MDSSILDVWHAASGTPFVPTIGKDRHFLIGAFLVFFGLLSAGYFSLNRSLLNVPLLGVPASLALGFGVVYMFCAVGVYV